MNPHTILRRVIPAALALLLALLPADAQSRRERQRPETVTVAGRVTLGSGTTDTSELDIFVQDAKRGIRITAAAINGRFAVGDSVIATGELDIDDGQTELENATIRVVEGARGLPAPAVIGLTPAELEAHIGRLVRVALRVSARDTRRSGVRLVVSDTLDASQQITIRQDDDGDAALGLARFSAGDMLNVVGVLTTRNGGSGRDVDYVLYPRAADDLRAIGLTRRAVIGVVAALMATLLGVAMIFVFRAARARHAADQKARESLELTRAVLNSTSFLIVATDADGRVLAANPAIARALGTTEADMPGRMITDLYAPEQLAARVAELQAIGATDTSAIAAAVGQATSGGTEEREWTLRCPGGTQVPVLTSTTALVNPDGSVRGFAIVASDISARKRAEEAESHARVEAERANRVKSEFLANMSHELRTPLNSIIGFANILLKNQQSRMTDKELGFLQRVSSNGRHLLGLINGILDLSKIEAGRIELEITPVEVGALVRETVAELESHAIARDLKLIAELPADPTLLNTDRHRLKQGLINLVGNALKFTNSGSVTVRVERDPLSGRASQIHIRDTGCGIPADKLETIFDAFRQADSTTARQYGGTGLGLTITRSLLQLMGFDIRVESTVGEGSTFTIVTEPWGTGEHRVSELLRQSAQRSRKPKGKGAATPAAVKPLLALIVDDEMDARIMLAQHLQDLGCDVVAAASADEGVALARKLTPDLITLDVMMPGKNGVNALRELKSDPILGKIPVVVVSVVAEEYRGRVFGAVDCLDKPVTKEALAEVLRRNTTPLRTARVLVFSDVPQDGTNYGELGASDAVFESVTTAAEARAAFDDGRVPNLIILDVARAGRDLFSWIAKIREDERVRYVPVVVVVPDEQAATAERALANRATVLRRNVELTADLKGIIAAVQGSPAPQAEGPPPTVGEPPPGLTDGNPLRQVQLTSR